MNKGSFSFVTDGKYTSSSVFMANLEKDGKLKRKNLGQKNVQSVFKL